MSENPVDRKASRIQVSAEEARKTAAARVQQRHRESELAIERERQKLALQRERRIARQQAKREKRSTRRHARTQFLARVNAIAPTAGRRAMITGPILAPMAVAWIGQIGFAHDKLGWPLLGAVVFAAAWELTTAFTGWMYHQARKDGDRGALFRFATWLFACSAGAMNYWHACPVVTERLNVQTVRQYVNLSPTPKAVSYGAMSLVGIALWELYSSLIHRKHLRAEGIVSSARPRFGILRWVRFTRVTWHAWSLAVRYGIKTVDDAWTAAVTEIDRMDREKAAGAARKRLAKDRRPEVRVTVVREVTHTVARRPRIRLYRISDQTTGGLSAIGTTSRTGANDQRPVTNERPRTGTPSGQTSGQANDRPTGTPTDRSDDRPETSSSDRPVGSGKDRPAGTRRTSGRQKRKASDEEENKRARAAYRDSVAAGNPLKERELATMFGRSKGWARTRIQEAGPQPVGGARRAPVSDPKDQPATSEVKTG
jgi:hypothetical protein